MQCEHGRPYYSETEVGCQKEARFLLQYCVDWALLEDHEELASDNEVYCCEKHLFDMDFVFDPNCGTPQRIMELPELMKFIFQTK